MREERACLDADRKQGEEAWERGSVDVNSCQEAGYAEADWGFDGGREKS